MFGLISHVVILLYHLAQSSPSFGQGVDEKSNNCSCCSCWNADFSCTDNTVVVNVTLENCHLIPKRFHLDILWYRSNMVSNATVDELNVAENKRSASIKRNWILFNVRIINVEVMITPMKCTEQPYCQCRPVQSGAICKTTRHVLPEFQDKTTKEWNPNTDQTNELTLEKNYIILAAVIVCAAVCVLLVSVMYRRNEMNRPVRRQATLNNRIIADGERVALQSTVTTSLPTQTN